MKFSCLQDNLNKGLGLVGHIASKNATLPILNNILITTTKAGIELTTTNLEVAVTTLVRGKVEKEGVVTVQSKLLSEAVQLMQPEKIDVELIENNLILTCGKQKVELRVVAADDFPVIPQFDPITTITANGSDIATAFARVVFAVNPDEGRPELAGVFVRCAGTGGVVVGTDGYRLGEASFGSAATKTNDISFIIPLRTAQEVLHIISGEQGQVEVALGESQVLWKTNETRLTSRLVAGQYPDYKQIIPKTSNTHIVVSRGELLRAVKLAGLFVRGGINDVKLVVDSTSKLLKVSAVNNQLGGNQNDITLVAVDGGGVEVVFNYRYMVEGLQAIQGDEVRIDLTDSKTAGVLRSADPTISSNYLYLIMPIRQ